MRTRLGSKIALLFVVCSVALLAFAGTAMAATPTIQSDQADYNPGATVNLSGSGWQPGESVHINVNDDQGQTWSRDADVTADQTGNITDTFQLPSTFVAVYKVTATGQQSGTATTTFTDGNYTVGIATTGTVTPTSWSASYKTYGTGSNADTSCSGTVQNSGTLSGGGNIAIGRNESAQVTGVTATGATFDYWSSSPTSTTPVTPGCVAGGSGTVGAIYAHFKVSDATAPTSTASATVPDGPDAGTDPDPYTAGSWTNQDVNVTLSATDNTGGTGVKEIRYTTDGTAPTKTTGTVYSAPIAVSSTTTIKYLAVDNAGNAESPNTFQVNIDKVAPAPNCGSADGNWHAADVSIACSPTDSGGSGLASSVPATFNLVTSVPAGTQTANASTDSKTISDVAGNPATAGPIGGNKVDKKAPNVSCGSADGNWHASDVSIACTADDTGGSGLANSGDGSFNLTTSVPAGTETANASTDSRDVADAVGNKATAGPVTGNKVDEKAPALTDNGPTPANPNGTNSWYTSAVTNSWTATDGGSGFAPSGALTKSITQSSGTNEGAVTLASGAVSDAVGNSASSVDSAAFKIDLTDPTNVAFVGGPDAGKSYDFGSVPAAPTCTAEDAVSGLKNCVVTDSNAGGTGAVGSHTLTAKATDNAGRTATATRSYTVSADTAKGFYAPVDMGGVLNTGVKAGSTIPVKFELFGGASNMEQKTTSAVGSMSAKQVSCANFTGDPTDQIEYLAPTNEATGLRYDLTSDQFIYNWKTPKQVGCYNLTMTAADNTTTLVAYFQLK